MLPKMNPELFKMMDCIPIASPEPVISNSLSFYLYDIKQRIDVQEEQWDIFKRYTNPYEYIHSTVPGKRKSVSKYKPLSRSYFKMMELVRFFHLLQPVENAAMRSFHLAEGPGGFIEALADVRRDRKSDLYVGMTIEAAHRDYGVPGWRKSHYFLQEHRTTVAIEKGIDGTGDILSVANLHHCIAKYGASMDLVTGDGGFDFSMNFNDQEIHITRLLFAQMVYALCMQKKGGSFILKLFDCFMPQTLDILAILSSFYDRVYITKPQTSRYANSEKYVVCKGFLAPTEGFLAPTDGVRGILVDTFTKMMTATTDVVAFRFLRRELPVLFLTRVEEYNAIFGQQQIENIYFTLSLIDNHKPDKLDALIKSNVQKCVHWCSKYGILHEDVAHF
jgi:23S rRNA U2552 (ribose-2'-O)-methylase RlmE/FtsJ